MRRVAAAASLAVSVLAIGMLSQAATAGPIGRTAPGAPSWKYAESGAAMRWQADSVSIAIDPTITELGPDAEEAVRAAIGAWVETDARLPSVSIDRASKRGKAKRDGVNRVLFAPIDVPGHEHDLAITVSYSDAETGAILEADIIINARLDFANVRDDGGDAKHDPPKAGAHGSCDAAYDLQNVATHELGHFFGLGEDSEDADASMYFKTSRCETKKRTLSGVDSGELVALYDTSPASEEPGVGCSLAQPRPQSSGYLGLLAAGALLALARRRR